MIHLFTDRFKVPDHIIDSLLAKHCEKCSICKGRRIVEENGELFKCQCLNTYKEEYQLYAANIPLEFHHLTKDDFIPEWQDLNETNFNWFLEYAKRLPRALETGFGLYLYGPAGGSGKTFLATLMLRKAIESGYTGYFIILRDLIDAAMDGLRDHVLQEDVEKLIVNTDFLVVDDVDLSPGAKDQDLINTLLITLFKKRMYNKKPLILTGSCKPEELNLVLNDHLTRVFLDHAHPLGYQGHFKTTATAKLSEEFFQ